MKMQIFDNQAETLHGVRIQIQWKKNCEWFTLKSMLKQYIAMA